MTCLHLDYTMHTSFNLHQPFILSFRSLQAWEQGLWRPGHLLVRAGWTEKIGGADLAT